MGSRDSRGATVAVTGQLRHRLKGVHGALVADVDGARDAEHDPTGDGGCLCPPSPPSPEAPGPCWSLDLLQRGLSGDAEPLAPGERVKRAGGVDDSPVGLGGQSRQGRAGVRTGGEAAQVRNRDDQGRVIAVIDKLARGGEAM